MPSCARLLAGSELQRRRPDARLSRPLRNRRRRWTAALLNVRLGHRYCSQQDTDDKQSAVCLSMRSRWIGSEFFLHLIRVLRIRIVIFRVKIRIRYTLKAASHQLPTKIVIKILVFSLLCLSFQPIVRRWRGVDSISLQHRTSNSDISRRSVPGKVAKNKQKSQS